MLHNLTPDRDKVWVTYDIDFIPATSPAAKGIKPARPIWMDVQNGETYPVFDVPRGSGHNGEYTYPDDATDPYHGGPAKNVWTVDAGRHAARRPRATCTPAACATTSGCSAPARSCPTDRGEAGRVRHRAPLLVGRRTTTSRPGPVSWDVTMSATPDDWRVQGAQGRQALDHRHLRTRARLVVRGHGDHGRVDGDRRPPAPTRSRPTSTCPGVLTHGHLPENDNHGGPTPDPKHYVDLTKLPSKMVPDGYVIAISNFVYARGDMSIATLGADDQGRAVAHVQQPRLAARQRHLAHDHRVQGAVRRQAPASRSRSPTRKIVFDSGELGNGGRARVGCRHVVDADRTCRRAPTRTSAGSTRSCGVRSASSPTEQPDRCGAALKWLHRRARRGGLARRGGFVAWYIFGSTRSRQAEAATPRPNTTRRARARRSGRGTSCAAKNVFVGYRIKELFGDALLKRDAVGRRRRGARPAHDRGRSGHGRGRQRRPARARERPRRARRVRARHHARDRQVPDRPLHAHRRRSRCPAASCRGQGAARPARDRPVAAARRDAADHVRPRRAVGTGRRSTSSAARRSCSPTTASTPPDTVIASVDDHGSVELDLTFAPGG